MQPQDRPVDPRIQDYVDRAQQWCDLAESLAQREAAGQPTLVPDPQYPALAQQARAAAAKGEKIQRSPAEWDAYRAGVAVGLAMGTTHRPQGAAVRKALVDAARLTVEMNALQR